jgi:hypothetical protein
MAALTALQAEILRRFFHHRSDFFVTGGAALVGFHLRHRTTNDLDLFTVGDVLDDAERTLGDEAPQVLEKLEIDGIVVDSPREILANKLCGLLSRVEARDLIDVKVLEEAGYDPIAALPLAERKDGGLSASQLAWVLSSFSIADSAELYDVPREELDRYRESLIERLSRAAFPGR